MDKEKKKKSLAFSLYGFECSICCLWSVDDSKSNAFELYDCLFVQ